MIVPVDGFEDLFNRAWRLRAFLSLIPKCENEPVLLHCTAEPHFGPCKPEPVGVKRPVRFRCRIRFAPFASLPSGEGPGVGFGRVHTSRSHQIAPTVELRDTAFRSGTRCKWPAFWTVPTRTRNKGRIMPKPYKLFSTRPLPAGAEIIQHEGRAHVRIRDERGRESSELFQSRHTVAGTTHGAAHA